MKKYKVTLEKEERENLEAITRKGSHQSQRVVNALILLNCDEGPDNERRMRGEDVATILRISMRKIDRVKRRFVEDGLEAAKASGPTRERPMATSRRTWWRSVAASRRRVLPDGHFACWPTAPSSSNTSAACRTRRSGGF